MTAIPVKVTEKEFAAIREYADMCGESVSCLIRKVVIQEITFMNNRGVKDPQTYEYHMLIPADISDDAEQKIIESNYNKIRKILGWKKISFGWK